MFIGMIVVMVYILGVIGSTFNRVTATMVMNNAVYKAIFGDEEIADLQEAEVAIAKIKGIMQEIKASRLKVKDQVTQEVPK